MQALDDKQYEAALKRAACRPARDASGIFRAAESRRQRLSSRSPWCRTAIYSHLACIYTTCQADQQAACAQPLRRSMFDYDHCHSFSAA